jgi:DNA-binding transcriptional ArsR family regulator
VTPSMGDGSQPGSSPTGVNPSFSRAVEFRSPERSGFLRGSDSFNAVAEPRRREILDFLAPGERPVGEIVTALDLAQPSVSKHLRVLLEVGLVEVRRDGRQAFYRTNADAIKPVHEWTGRFERYWRDQLTRVKKRAEDATQRRPS